MFVLMLRGVLVCIVLGSYWMSGIWLSHYNIRANRWPVRVMRIAGAAALIRRAAKNYRTQNGM